MVLSVGLDTRATTLPQDRCDALRRGLAQVSTYLDHRAQALGATWPPVRLLLADDFTGAVQGVLDHLNGPDAMPAYGTMRMGGTVAAKTMPDPECDGGSLIVADASMITLDDPDIVGVPAVTQALLIAHELTHVLIGVTRRASGIDEAFPAPSGPSEHFAREAVRIAADEYRADMVAAETIGAVCYVVTDEGERLPGTPLATAAVSFIGCIVDDLPALHPLLPDTVDRYRTHQISLEEMWGVVQRHTTQAFNLLAHAQALMDSTLPAKHNLLTAHNLASRASDLYLREAWGDIHQVLAAEPVLPSAADHTRIEPALLAAGVQAIHAFWSLLGVDVVPQPDGSDYLRVGAPTR